MSHSKSKSLGDFDVVAGPASAFNPRAWPAEPRRAVPPAARPPVTGPERRPDAAADPGRPDPR